VSDGAEFLNTPLSAPAFIRMESSLLRAFTALPQVEAPVNLLDNKTGFFKLRIYESHSRKYAQQKILMFNDGEITVLKQTGLQPVFFSETIDGPMMPNFTCMPVVDSMTGRDQYWAGFVQRPEWIAMRDDPQYKGMIIIIADIIMRPLPFSQL